MPCANGCTKCELPEGAEWRYGDVFVKQIKFPGKGALGQQHSHEYDHLTLVGSGGVELWAHGEIQGRFWAPAVIPIQAGVKHGFEALADDTVLYCVHNLRGGNTPTISGG